MERALRGRIEAVRDVWTTKEALEGWWDPEGLMTTVRTLDGRHGGDLEFEY